jgi:hypothetical protein
MRAALTAASEAEKSAVLAAADQDSRTYADEARSATGRVERANKELEDLLTTGGTEAERDFLRQFSEAFAEVQRIDGELLSLVVKNTNLKAYRLAFGPAAAEVEEMDHTLSRLVTKYSRSPESAAVTRLALGADAGTLRIQALLAPHIAEATDQKMDELEARMADDDREVRKDLGALAAIANLHGDPDLESRDVPL